MDKASLLDNLLYTRGVTLIMGRGPPFHGVESNIFTLSMGEHPIFVDSTYGKGEQIFVNHCLQHTVI